MFMFMFMYRDSYIETRVRARGRKRGVRINIDYSGDLRDGRWTGDAHLFDPLSDDFPAQQDILAAIAQGNLSN